MINMLNCPSVFGEWTLRLERLDSLLGTIAVVVLFVMLAFAVVCLYASVKREITSRQRKLLLVCRLLAVLTLFLFCMRPSIVQWRDQSRVVVLCDTSRSMNISESESQDSKGESKTRLRRVLDFLCGEGRDKEFQSRRPLVHELQCNTIGETLTRSCSIEPGEDWQARLADWCDGLRADGKESRLAEQIGEIVEREKNHALAGIVLLSDGCNNIGVGNDALLEQLRTSPCPVHVVAVGAEAPVFEYGVMTLRAPSRSRLHSEIPVSVELARRGVLNGTGEPKNCVLDLYLIAQDSGDNGVGDELPTIVPGTKPVASLSFYMTNRGKLFASESEAREASAVEASTASDEASSEQSLKIQTRVKATSCGRFVLVAQLRNPRLPVMRHGKPFTAIEIFDKQDKILLVAGGPLRDFQFCESRLKRSTDVSTDVYLAFAKRFYHLEPLTSGDRVDPPAVDKTSNATVSSMIQERFTSRFLSDYDAIVAFDPDWKESFTISECEAVEEWVSRQGGGLVVTSGPVFAGQQIDGWTQSSKTKVIRSLYPVRFFAEGTRVESAFSTLLPRRVRLRVKDELESGPLTSIGYAGAFDWSDFPGFYGALPVAAVKPGATLWATLEAPSHQAESDDDLAVVFASQRYGAGRVFYIGTTELWRLRMVEESLPDRLLSNLIQYVTEGRREKVSPFGRLSVDREVVQPGATVAVQAMLNDVNARPLLLDHVSVETKSPQGEKAEIKLVPRKDMSGVYDGTLIVSECGRWNVSCPVPGTNESLQTSFFVKESDLESPPSYRDENFLREIAKITGGQYMNADAVSTSGNVTSLLESLPAFQRVAVEDRAAQQVLRVVLLSFLCLLFLIEWLSRRMMGLV